MPAMNYSTLLHAALTTVLLFLCCVRVVLVHQAFQENSLHKKLHLALSVPMIVLQALLVGLSWSGPSDTEMEVIAGVTSLFPSSLVVSPITNFSRFVLTVKRQYIWMIILLRSLISTPSLLRMCLPLIAVSSCLIKITATLTGTYVYHPMHFVVLFLLFLDYLTLASFLWWLDGHTTAHSRTQSQLRCAIYCIYGMAAILLLIAVLGTVLDCWLLSTEVNAAPFRGRISSLAVHSDFYSFN
ncbi:unnamed protein product [Penicillium salamii]|nr:unnamed protein product [Penicillium salamii]